MYTKEKFIVDEKFVKRLDTYNISTGGTGNFLYINHVGRNRIGIKNFLNKLINDLDYRKKYCKKLSEAIKKV